MKERFTIKIAAEKVGVSYKTIMRWEETGRIDGIKRDYKGWRMYTEKDVERMKKIKETLLDEEEYQQAD